MLAERVKEWTREWKEEGLQAGLQAGRQEGLQQGLESERRMLARLVKRRYGSGMAESVGPLLQEIRELSLLEALSDYHSQGTLFPVVRVEIDYKSPAGYGEILEIETKLTNLSRASFTLEHTVKSKSDPRLIVQGITRIACLNKSGRPIRLPPELKAMVTIQVDSLKAEG
ncbi:MAG: hotdog domain-containing protein [bacterium]|nr:hotdog domain-containing protein [bacterium]